MADKIKCNRCQNSFPDISQLVRHKNLVHLDGPQGLANELQRLSDQAIHDFLSSDGSSVALFNKAKQASAYRMSLITRERNRIQREALIIMAAKELGDETVLKKYINRTIEVASVVHEIEELVEAVGE